MDCEYCGTKNQEGGKCSKCGAPIDAPVADAALRSGPSFYEGYIVYTLSNWQTDSLEYQFWLGRELMERIRVSRKILDEFVGEGCDPMPFIWKLFLVARGELEVLEWQEKNNRLPAFFEIRKSENPMYEQERQLWRSILSV
jgi:hypothetical protein